MKTRTGLFALITALLLLCAPAAFAAPETADTAPTIADPKAAVLVEYSTGKILYEMWGAMCRPGNAVPTMWSNAGYAKFRTCITTSIWGWLSVQWRLL